MSCLSVLTKIYRNVEKLLDLIGDHCCESHGKCERVQCLAQKCLAEFASTRPGRSPKAWHGRTKTDNSGPLPGLLLPSPSTFSLLRFGLLEDFVSVFLMVHELTSNSFSILPFELMLKGTLIKLSYRLEFERSQNL